MVPKLGAQLDINDVGKSDARLALNDASPRRLRKRRNALVNESGGKGVCFLQVNGA